MLERSWSIPFAEKAFPAINEQNFSVLYSDKASRPNTPVNVLIGALILKEFLGQTDYEVVESLRSSSHRVAAHFFGLFSAKLRCALLADSFQYASSGAPCL